MPTDDLPGTHNKRIAILISGRGSNMIALVEAVSAGLVPDAEVSLVVSDKANAAGLASASRLGLRAVAIPLEGLSRGEHESRVIELLRDECVDLICLAGYMRLLSPAFIEAFRGRILNIHPSLLPSFPGLDAQQQALDHGVKVTGCTVHFVDDTLDGGPIIAQRCVQVMNTDTVDELSARILIEEHKLYREALALVVSGEYEVVGRTVKAKG